MLKKPAKQRQRKVTKRSRTERVSLLEFSVVPGQEVKPHSPGNASSIFREMFYRTVHTCVKNAWDTLDANQQREGKLCIEATNDYARAAVPAELEDRVKEELTARIAQFFKGEPAKKDLSIPDKGGGCRFRVWFSALPLATGPAKKHTGPQPEIVLLSYEDRLPSHTDVIKTLFSDLPTDHRKRVMTVVELYNSFRNHAAQVLQPSITALLKEASALDYTQKHELADLINQALRDTRLSILDPVTKLPAKLNAHRARPTSPSSTLRLQDTRKGSDGSQHRTPIQELDFDQAPISLVETPHTPHRSGPRRGTER